MQQIYQFSISGMTCHSCANLIQMDLEDTGFTLQSITHDPGLLTMKLNEPEVERVKQIIESNQKYHVTHIIRL